MKAGHLSRAVMAGVKRHRTPADMDALLEQRTTRRDRRRDAERAGYFYIQNGRAVDDSQKAVHIDRP